MSKKDHEKFDRELLAGDPARTSHGTGALMAVMGIRMPQPGPVADAGIGRPTVAPVRPPREATRRKRD